MYQKLCTNTDSRGNRGNRDNRVQGGNRADWVHNNSAVGY